MLSRATGIPVAKMMEGEKEKLLRMEEELHKRVIGQNEAVDAVAMLFVVAVPVFPIRIARLAPSCS